jgi:glycosyltransferase involved in cell wall biosynthesis
MRIAFVWQGVSGRYGFWKDGLYSAMKHIEEKHEVRYIEPWEEVMPDEIVLYWESACTINGKDGENYKRIQQLPNKKALLFAGGPVQKEWFFNFDHVFVEGEFNKQELYALDISCSIAFGVNEEIFFPEKQQKTIDGFMQATFASWKRQPLFAEALGSKGLLCGRYQEEDQSPWVNSSQSVRLPELPAEAVARLINASHAVVNTSEYWGGGQRCTLEAMACNVPAIVMSDSPKNREFVEESGAGIVCDPTPEAIRQAVGSVKGKDMGGKKYIESKWTSRHYADSLLKFIVC